MFFFFSYFSFFFSVSFSLSVAYLPQSVACFVSASRLVLGAVPPSKRSGVQFRRYSAAICPTSSRSYRTLIDGTPYFLRPLRPNWIRTTALRAAIYRPCLGVLPAISPFLVYLREPIPGSHRNQRCQPHGFFEVKHSGTIFCERNAMKRIFCKAVVNSTELAGG